PERRAQHGGRRHGEDGEGRPLVPERRPVNGGVAERAEPKRLKVDRPRARRGDEQGDDDEGERPATRPALIRAAPRLDVNDLTLEVVRGNLCARLVHGDRILRISEKCSYHVRVSPAFRCEVSTGSVSDRVRLCYPPSLSGRARRYPVANA